MNRRKSMIARCLLCVGLALCLASCETQPQTLDVSIDKKVGLIPAEAPLAAAKSEQSLKTIDEDQLTLEDARLQRTITDNRG